MRNSTKITNKFDLLLPIFLILTVGVIAYFNSLFGSFVYDDLASVLNKSIIREFSSISTLFWAFPSRFVTNFSFVLNQQFFGRENAFYYHLISLIFHLITGLTVYGIIRLLSTKSIALVATLIFVVHPLQTQSVAYIAQRGTVVAGCFYLLTLFFYLLFRLKSQKWLFAFLTFICFLLAIFSKENALTLPLAILLTEGIFFTKKLKELPQKLIRLTPFFLVFAMIIFWWFHQQGEGILSVVQLPSVTQGRAITRSQYLYTQFPVITKYLQLLVVPLGQNLDYDFLVEKTFGNWRVLLSLSLICLLSAAGFYFLKKNKLLSFAIFFFFLTLLPESSIIPIADVINEHRLYLPLFGFAVSLSILISFIGNYYRKIFAVMILIALYAYLTYLRNQVWHDSFTLWSDVVKKSPQKARAHYSLGMAYFLEKEDTLQGKVELEKALSLDPYNAEVYNNLGSYYYESGNLEKALKYYQQSLNIKAADELVLSNLAAVYFRSNDLDKAGAVYHQLLKSKEKKYQAFAHNGLGLIYFQQGNLKEAEEEFKMAVAIYPNYRFAYENLVNLYDRLNRKEEAQEMRKIKEGIKTFKYDQ